MQSSPPPYFYPNYNPFDLYTKLRCDGIRFRNRTGIRKLKDFLDYDQNILKKYAKFLGFKLKKYPQLFHFVIESLTTHLPQGWTEGFDSEGVVYYRNEVANKCYRIHPLDAHYKEVIKHEIKQIKRQKCFCF